MRVIEITGSDVKLKDVVDVAHRRAQMVLAPQSREKVAASRKFITEKITKGEVIYGVNTGFGAFSSVRISDGEIEQLQRNLIRSHSAGVGEPLSKEVTRAVIFLRANALARGHSGIRPEVIDKLCEFLKLDILPVIPEQGSVGASGDLAPLSHLALGLIGEGMVWSDQGPISAAAALKEKGVEPLALQAKEGLSLINGCQVMTAIGFLNLEAIIRLVYLADTAGCITLEAMKGTRTAFHPLISMSRPHVGEATTANNLRKILGESSEISKNHADCDKVQDAYSLRCMPQVHGALKDALHFVVQVLEREANSSTDNPLVFAKDGQILSGGNFHGQPVANALDFLKIALISLSSISQCRTTLLINPAMSGLPAFLAKEGGLNSGHMIVQVAAAALLSECKALAYPPSVDSLPTSADKEDHVSMGTISARHLEKVVKLSEKIIAIEYLSALQALEFQRPLTSSKVIEFVHASVRENVPFAEVDRVFSSDISEVQKCISSDDFMEELMNLTGGLEW